MEKTEDMMVDDTPMDTTEENYTDDELTMKARQEWITQFRLKFCAHDDPDPSKNVIHPDGSLNQDYFRPPKDAKIEEARKWGEAEKALLIEGIEKHGIGHFGEISKESLPKWSTNDLRVKCIRLIGRQNLQLYRDWKGNAEDITREYEANKKIGLEYGSWKQGVLVYDDAGNVEKALLEHHKEMEKRKKN
ncbi:uncharacterized protein EV154DRAFT_526790 [Mucor mucedo]|uniref:uncharacterized protein n=1 Tax=Mucor mucedo TaxID=29922 RepID=UPI002220BEC9|nr:uncharacterized protein EV154DRAFT_526790 [Mucor mucedo]KAI7875067.1 hypothetical protein EV154DRAFT_526790 [Mucor mucedo]